MDKQRLIVKHCAEKMAQKVEIACLKADFYAMQDRHADCVDMLHNLLNDKDNGLTKAARSKLARFVLQDAMKAKFMGVGGENLVKVFDEVPGG